MKNPLRLIIALSAFLCHPAFAQPATPFQHPRDQIALQLGAIQMGYAVPFSLSPGNPANAQQAANALVMGRNALNATAARPAARVQGVVSSPAVDTVEYRDQLYQAVEAVVTSPVLGTIKGSVNLEVGKKQSITARLTFPLNSYTIPVPFALESSTSVTSLDAQGLLSGQLLLPANSIGSSQISSGAIRSIHLAPGTLSSMEVVNQNTTALPNRSYFVPDSDVAVSLPSNASVGDVVKVFGKGGKVTTPANQGISRWTFRKIPGALIEYRYHDHTIKSSLDATKIYVGSNETIFGSHDSGKTWSLLKAGDQFSLVDCSDDGNIILAREENPDTKFLLSKDAGASWTELNLGSGQRESVGISPDGSKIFQFGYDSDTGENVKNSIKASTDGGGTWQSILLPPGVELDGSQPVKFSGNGMTIVFLAYNNNTGTPTLVYSTNMGDQWVDGITAGLGAIRDEGPFAISRDGISMVAFGFDENRERGVRYLSTDAGATWSLSDYIAPKFENEVWPVGAGGFLDGKFLFSGKLKSYDKGARWSFLKIEKDSYGHSSAYEDETPIIPVRSSFNGDRLIGVANDYEMEGIYTSWSDEFFLEGDGSVNFIYLGNGNWSAEPTK